MSNIFKDEIVPFIKEKYDGVIKENDKDIIAPYIADIYVPEYNFVIVYEDLLYNSIGCHDTIKELNAYSDAQLRRDLKKKNKNILHTCRSKDINLFIIWENELANDKIKDIWKSMILNKLDRSEHKYYARACEIKELDPTTARLFFEENHIQGNTPSVVKLGLYKDGELISALSMGKPRYNKAFGWEIIRFCSKKYCNNVGAGNKLFKYFIDKYSNGENVITYANSRWSTQGAFYQELGFEPKDDSQENYFYFKEDEKHLYPRVRMQKHKLCNVLPKFDPEMTEMENVMFLNRIPLEEEGKSKSLYRQIYDSGNICLHYIQKSE